MTTKEASRLGMAITIKPPNIQALTLPIKGKTPLIVNRFDEKARSEMLAKQMKKAKGLKEAKSPEDCYKRSRYIMEGGGGDGFPTVAFKSAAVRAAKFVGGITMTDARQMFFVVADGRTPIGEECVKIVGGHEMREDVYHIAGDTTDLRHRAEFRDWSASLTIEYNADAVSAEVIANLFTRAGFSVGVGEGRPEHNGINGTFTVGDYDAQLRMERRPPVCDCDCQRDECTKQDHGEKRGGGMMVHCSKCDRKISIADTRGDLCPVCDKSRWPVSASSVARRHMAWYTLAVATLGMFVGAVLAIVGLHLGGLT